jgi:hypothetical protein
MKTLTQKTIESLTAKAEHHWTRAHGAKAKGMDGAYRFQIGQYNRVMKAVHYLTNR